LIWVQDVGAGWVGNVFAPRTVATFAANSRFLDAATVLHR
jgi:hypothetical protein